MLEQFLLHSCISCSRFLRKFLKTDFMKPNISNSIPRNRSRQFKMSDSTTNKPKKTISEEQLAKMQAAAKATREKRNAEEAAHPELKEKRLAEAKAKREAKKAKKESDGSSSEDKPANGGAGAAEESAGAGKRKSKPKAETDEKKEKKPSWWSTATEEQKAAAKAKAKASRDAKKAEKTKEASSSE